MASRAAFLACLVAFSWPARISADQTSAAEPVEHLSCNDVFDRGEVSQGYVDRMVGFAFGDTEDPRLSKWTNGLRIVIRSDVVPQDFVRAAILDFSAALPHVDDFYAAAYEDVANHARFRDGDLLVYLTWHRSQDREAAKLRYKALLQEFNGSALTSNIHAVVGANDDQRFVGVIRSDDGDIRRTVVVIDLEYAQLGKQPAVLELLTTAINPNPGNAIKLGLPGSAPEEKRIYEKTWHSQVSYDLSWTREFHIYLEILLGRDIAPGMTKTQFAEAVRAIMDRPRMKRHLAAIYECDATGN